MATPGVSELNIVLCALDEAPAEMTLLDARERRRAERLQSELDRRRFVAAHTALRRELGQRLDTDPAGLEFSRAPCKVCGAPHGRPIVVPHGGSLARRAGLHFSLSHSAGQALLAFAPTPVGVDIEALPDPAMCERLIALLHPREQARIRSAPREAQQIMFTCLWCRKEAYLKALGVGLTHESTESYLGSLESTPGWRVQNIEAPTGFAGAVATGLVEAVEG